jgi:hypothetical protein
MRPQFKDRLLQFLGILAIINFLAVIVCILIIPAIAIAQGAVPVSTLSVPTPATGNVWRDFFSAALALMLPVALSVISLAAVKLLQLINAHVKNATAQGILGRLDSLAEGIVRETLQTTVDAAKAANANGKLPTDVALAARDAAVTKLKGTLGAEGLADIEKVLGVEGDDAIGKFLITTIEAKVHQVNS